jgi:hypothetical protein
MKLFIENRSNLLNELLCRVELTTNLLEADAVITWNGVLQQQTRLIELAKEYNKPVAIISHGHNSENDHNPKIIDNSTGQDGKPMTADKYLCYGQQGKDILLESGIPEDKIAIVGCPICWTYKYLYGHGKEKAVISGYAGKSIVDPTNGKEWKLLDQKVEPVKHLGGNRIAYFPNHSMTERQVTKGVYNSIKNVDNLCIKGSKEWLLLKEDNPFQEILDDKTPARIAKMINPDIKHANNIEIVKDLIAKSAVVVCDIPSTLNLIAYACGVPVVMPDIDLNIRKDGERHDIFRPCDYVVPIKDIKKTVKKIIKDGHDKDLKAEAEYNAGISYGNPTENILKELKTMIDSRK